MTNLINGKISLFRRCENELLNSKQASAQKFGLANETENTRHFAVGRRVLIRITENLNDTAGGRTNDQRRQIVVRFDSEGPD